MKYARRCQSSNVTRVLILDCVKKDVVDAGMEYAPTLSKTVVVRPEVALVLIAPNTGLDHVVLIVTSVCRSRPIMVKSEFASHRSLGYPKSSQRSCDESVV